MRPIPDPTDGDVPFQAPEIQERVRLYRSASPQPAEEGLWAQAPDGPGIETTLTRQQIRKWREAWFCTAGELEAITLPSVAGTVQLTAHNSTDGYTARFYFNEEDGRPKMVIWAD